MCVSSSVGTVPCNLASSRNSLSSGARREYPGSIPERWETGALLHRHAQLLPSGHCQRADLFRKVGRTGGRSVARLINGAALRPPVRWLPSTGATAMRRVTAGNTMPGSRAELRGSSPSRPPQTTSPAPSPSPDTRCAPGLPQERWHGLWEGWRRVGTSEG
jgi:hypothetical protein